MERCIVANPAPAATSFNESGLATISLPAKASKSLLCFTLTPLASILWQNNLATPASARFSANAMITIDNDVLGTEVTFGFDTAVSIATEAIDRLHTTTEAHERIRVVEVMGRHAGWIALHAGMAGGADVILLPEVPSRTDTDMAWIEAGSAPQTS